MSIFKTLSSIPEDFPDGYTYKIQSGGVMVKEISDENSAKEWIEALKTKSCTSWTVSRTYPCSGKEVVFKQEWKCHHNVQHRGGAKEPQRTSKNLNCPAIIRLTTYRVVKNSRSKKGLAHDFPCYIEINTEHNHLIRSAAVLHYRKMGEDTREKLISLFRKGYTAATAREALKLDLFIENADNFFEKSADGFYVPTLATVQYLFNKTFENTYGAKEGDDMEKDLQMMLQKYNNSSSGRAVFQKVENHLFVAICTPIMLRAHVLLPQSSEMVLIDASGHMDKLGHRIYFIITPTPAGGIPLGCIITDTEKQELFLCALEALKSLLPDNCFYKQTYPTVIMTDDDLRERGPLKTVWCSSILLLCQFHVLKAMWTWLLSKKHGILKTDRQEMYFAFKQLVHAGDEDKLQQHLVNLNNKYEEKYPNFTHHVADLYQRKECWADVYRQNLPIRGNNTNNYVETVFRILKDCILERVKAFNLTHLVDFILSRYENYMERRLIDFSQGKYCKALLKKYLPSHPQDFDFTTIVRTKDPEVFHVPSRTDPALIHIVDAKHGFCSCYSGSSGKLCWHLGTVITHFCVTDNLFTASQHAKEVIFEVATGKKIPTGWLLPLHSKPEETENNKMEIQYESCQKPQPPPAEKPCSNPPSMSLSETLTSTTPLTEQEINDLRSIFDRIINCATDNPLVFAPAARKMLKNYKTHVKTDNALESAMHTFGKYTGQAAVNYNQRKGVMIGVQPQSVSRRKEPLGGKRKLQPGKPPQATKRIKELRSHDYTTFGRMPARKVRAPHSLQECIFQNKAVGHKSQAD